MLSGIKCMYSRTPLFRARLIRSPRYFEGRWNSLGFTLPLYASPVISKSRYFELFFHFPWDFEITGFDCIYKFCILIIFDCHDYVHSLTTYMFKTRGMKATRHKKLEYEKDQSIKA